MLSQKLKALRAEKGISQATLASILGVTQQAVAKWEREKAEPDSLTIKNIADYFNVTTDYLLGHDKTKKIIDISDDEKKILKGYRGLNLDDRRTIASMIETMHLAALARSKNVGLSV